MNVKFTIKEGGVIAKDLDTTAKGVKGSGKE